MKKVLFTYIFFFMFVSMSFAGGATGGWGVCDVNRFDETTLNQFHADLSVAFPVNLLVWARDFLDNLSGVSAVSPAGVTLHLVGIDFQPLSFLDSGTFDVIFQVLRYLFLASILMSVVKYVMEVVL